MSAVDAPLHKKPIRSLLEAARASPAFSEIYPGRTEITMAAPRIIGPGRCDPVSGFSRTVFYAPFDNVRLRRQSNFLELDDSILLDYQGDELDAIPMRIEDDATVMALDGRDAFVADEEDVPILEEPEVLSLVGFTAEKFGHWLGEYLLQWATVRDRPQIRNLPILIDDLPFAPY